MAPCLILATGERSAAGKSGAPRGQPNECGWLCREISSSCLWAEKLEGWEGMLSCLLTWKPNNPSIFLVKSLPPVTQCFRSPGPILCMSACGHGAKTSGPLEPCVPTHVFLWLRSQAEMECLWHWASFEATGQEENIVIQDKNQISLL